MLVVMDWREGGGRRVRGWWWGAVGACLFGLSGK